MREIDIKTAFTKVKKDVSSISDEIRLLSGKIDKNSIALSLSEEIKKEIDDLKKIDFEKFSKKLDSDLSKVNDFIEHINERTDKMANILSDFTKQIESDQKKLLEFKEKIEDVRNNSENNTVSMKVLNDHTAEFEMMIDEKVSLESSSLRLETETNFAKIAGDLSKVSMNVEELKSKTKEFSTSKLEKEVSKLTENVEALQKENSKNNGSDKKIDNLAKDFKKLDSLVDKLNSEVRSFKSAKKEDEKILKDFEIRINKNISNELEKLSNTNSEFEELIDEKVSLEIGSLRLENQSNLSKLEKDISKLSTDKLEKEVSKLSQKVNSIDSSKDIEKKITSMNKDLEKKFNNKLSNELERFSNTNSEFEELIAEKVSLETGSLRLENQSNLSKLEKEVSKLSQRVNSTDSSKDIEKKMSSMSKDFEKIIDEKVSDETNSFKLEYETNLAKMASNLQELSNELLEVKKLNSKKSEEVDLKNFEEKITKKFSNDISKLKSQIEDLKKNHKEEIKSLKNENKELKSSVSSVSKSVVKKNTKKSKKATPQRSEKIKKAVKWLFVDEEDDETKTLNEVKESQKKKLEH